MVFMKLSLLAVSSVLFFALAGSSAMAQKSKKSARSMASGTSSISKSEASSSFGWMKDKLSVGLIISTASEIDGASLQNTQTKEKLANIDFTSSTGYAVNSAYTSYLNPQFDWYAGVQIYGTRALDKFTIKSGSTKFSDSYRAKPTFQPWIAYGGVNFKANDTVYIPMGFNLTVLNAIQKGSLKSFSMDPAIGLQIGVGAKIEKRVALELMYQRTRYALNAEWEDNAPGKITGDVNMDGLNLTGRYIF